MISFHDDATPICGFSQSSSPIPTARSMPRAAAFSRPSVTSRLRGLMSGVPVVDESLGMPGCYAAARATYGRPSQPQTTAARTASTSGRCSTIGVHESPSSTLPKTVPSRLPK